EGWGLGGDWDSPNPFGTPQNPPNPPQVALLDLNFLPTSGSAMTKQQLLLARECPKTAQNHPKNGPKSPPKTAQNRPKNGPKSPKIMAQSHPKNVLSHFFVFRPIFGMFCFILRCFIPILGVLSRFCPQYLMEGSYNKVFLAKGNIPAESYTFFIDILLDTISFGGRQQKAEDPPTPSTELATQVIEYARQLEMIV
uniref:Uncharacterized protein n=1 Tax=Ficedula albicollis TaxID=59894 RepID=A0A803VZX7_FICAL